MVIKVERLRLIKTIVPLDSLVGLRTCGASRLLTRDNGSLGTGFGRPVFGCRRSSREPHGKDKSYPARPEPTSLKDSHADARSLPVISLLSFINFRQSPERVTAPEKVWIAVSEPIFPTAALKMRRLNADSIYEFKMRLSNSSVSFSDPAFADFRRTLELIQW
jgi:hypothetical protein